jgi:hypothetical protein
MKKLCNLIIVQDGDTKLRVTDLRYNNYELKIEIFDWEDLRFNYVYQDDLVDLGYGVDSDKYKELESMFDKEL